LSSTIRNKNIYDKFPEKLNTKLVFYINYKHACVVIHNYKQIIEIIVPVRADFYTNTLHHAL